MNTSSGKSSSRISSSQEVRPEGTSHETPSRKSRAWKILSHFIDYGVPLAISVLLVVWLFKKVDFHEMMQVIHDGCNFWWVFLMMAITTLSHMIRGVRWGIQLRGAGVPRMPFLMECVPIFGAYSLNLVFPRLGEVWRCVYVSRRENVKLATVVGTDIADRGSDAVVVGLLTIACLFVSRPALVSFMEHYQVGRDIWHTVDNIWLWIGLIVVITLFWSILHYGKKLSVISRIDGSLERMWIGFKVLFYMKGRGKYVVLTIGIWLCYFMEMYVMFFAFPFTRSLITSPGMGWGFVPGLVIFVFGAWSMAVPSNGGLGPWNLAVMFALSLYGINDTEGTAFSMVMWGSQAVWLVVEGLFSAAYIVADRHRQKPHLTH